jgi:excisionase family DNA binding protein
MEAATEKFLTTGQVAEHCGVSFRTVLRWIQRGHLRAQRLPGRGDHRVEAEEFVRFLSAHQMKIPSRFERITKAIAKPRALIVDDDALTARSIERLLRVEGLETDRASDGFEAGLKLNTFKPALMTLDLKMKGMNGFDVLKTLRANDSINELKILVISGDSHENLKRALREGAHEVLAKPFTAAELGSKLKSLLPNLKNYSVGDSL